MKRITLTIIFLITVSLSSLFCQEKEDLQKVKDALVNSTIHSQMLDQQLSAQTAQINKFIADIKAVKTIAQLDSIRTAYGIAEPKKGK